MWKVSNLSQNLHSLQRTPLKQFQSVGQVKKENNEKLTPQKLIPKKCFLDVHRDFLFFQPVGVCADLLVVPPPDDGDGLVAEGVADEGGVLADDGRPVDRPEAKVNGN